MKRFPGIAAVPTEKSHSVIAGSSLNVFEKSVPKGNVRIAVLRIVKQEECYLVSRIQGIDFDKAVIKGFNRILGPAVVAKNEGFGIGPADASVE